MEPGEIDLPSETPLVVGETALVRTPRSVIGVSLRTGKREWEYPTLESEPQYNPRQTVANPYTGGVVTVQPAKLATRHTISSDGRLVYVVEERGNQPLIFPGMFTPWGRGGTPPTGPGSYNLLRTREIDTQGKLVWEVGGETGEDEPDLAGVFFLGAPLPLGGQLYVIGESKGEISLFVLDVATGKLDWHQPLAQVDTPIAADSFRRLHGAICSYADGVLVCPTGAGAVVAVDITRRTLVWPYSYPRNQSPNPVMMRRTGDTRLTPFSQDRWSDGAAIIQGGKALVTPADSDQLHCIDLLDGKSWKIARGENLYVGCVHNGVVVLIARNHAVGVRLDDGKEAWPAVKLAAESPGMPSGRGFLSAGHYFIPLTSAEVVKLDVTTGSIKSRTRSRGGYVPGNLISFRGDVLSLTDNSLDCYHQLDEREQWAATTLRDKPNDPDALATYGEILIDQGQLASGIEQLERSLAISDSERVRGMLIEAHLEALRTILQVTGFEQTKSKNCFSIRPSAGVRAADGRRVGKKRSGARRVRVLRQDVPAGRESRGARGRGAWRTFGAQRPLGAGEDCRLAQVGIPGGTATDGRDNFPPFGDDARRRGGAAAVRDLLWQPGDWLGSHAKLIGALADREEWLEIEWRLLRQTRSADRETSAAAYLLLAETMDRAGRPADAARCYERLLTKPLADVTVRGEHTGREVIESLPADSPVRLHLGSQIEWPTMVAKTEIVPQPLDYYGSQLDIGFGRQPFLEHLSLELDQGRQELFAHDGLGAELFRVALQDSVRLRRYGFDSPAWARAAGHILVVQADTQVLAIDAFSTNRDSKSRVLWRQDLTDMLGTSDGSVQVRFMHVPNRRMRPQWVNQNGEPVGGIWPIGHELVCVQRGTKLLAIDVFSGQVLWTRHDASPTSEIFGDDEYVFVVPANGSEAIVLRATDGQKVGERRVPSSDRVTTYGRKIVTFSGGGGKQTARVYDAWTEQDIWQRTVLDNQRADRIGRWRRVRRLGQSGPVRDLFPGRRSNGRRCKAGQRAGASRTCRSFALMIDILSPPAGRSSRQGGPQRFAVQSYSSAVTQ